MSPLKKIGRDYLLRLPNSVVSVEEHLESVKDFKKQNNFYSIFNGDIAASLEHLCLNNPHNCDILLVIGSFTLMPEARRFFGYDDESDGLSLQENYDLIKRIG